MPGRMPDGWKKVKKLLACPLSAEERNESRNPSNFEPGVNESL
jgi:hypothetical protein